MNTVRQACASFALAFTISIAASSMVLADPPADKGKDKSAQSGGEQHGNSGQQGKGEQKCGEGLEQMHGTLNLWIGRGVRFITGPQVLCTSQSRHHCRLH